MRRFLCLVVLLALAVPAHPSAPPPVVYEPWTVEDIVGQSSATEFQISPDGRYAIWVKRSPEKDRNAYVGQLFRTDLKTGREVQLTRSVEACTQPRWSPDGKLVAFLSTRPAPRSKDDKSRGRRGQKAKDDDDPKTQVWLIDPTGGEPWPLTELTRDVSLYAWAGSDAVIVAAQEEPTRRETVVKDKDKDTTLVIEDEPNEPPVRLFRVEVESKKVKRVTDNSDRIEQLAVSPDGKFAAAVHGRSLRYIYDNKIKPIVILHDLKAGTNKRIFRDPKLNISRLLWSPDGKTVYATNDHNSKPQYSQAGVTELYRLEVATGKHVKVALGWDRGLSGQEHNGDEPGLLPLKDGFLALLADGVRVKPARYTFKGNLVQRQWLSGDHVQNTFGWQVSADGKTLLYAHSTPSIPTQWYRAALDGTTISRATPMARINDFLNKRRKARTEVVRWKGANKEVVEGILYYPHHYKPGTKAPLIVMLHGGPASADLDGWEETWAYAANLLCQRGAFILKPNYHGSTRYGLPWMESITEGKYCEPEVEDIEKGVDALIARGLVDSNKLALHGWSNGAILTNVLVSRTTRYKAAVAGAGSIEYISDWASCEFGEAFDRYYLGKSPLEDLQLYIRKSPFYRLDKVTTPTLIFFGSEDRVVHPQQGWAHYRGLQQLGKTPVRFVQFPGARHSLKKLSHQRRKVTEELAWYDRHLFKTMAREEILVKKDSPLAWALARQKASTFNGRYGLPLKGVLIPEIVRFGSLDVGRFEVTRAQYAAFDAGYKVAAGTEDYAATGITYEKAGAYCAWLSKKTGRTYRLPKESETSDLYDEAGSGDNTLDRWAGFVVNPDDARQLRRKLQALADAALVWKVGSGRGLRKGKGEMVFDLGGNVAEWVQGKDGKGLLKGGSADTPADVKGKTLEPGPAYRGFRVVRD